MSHVQGLAFQVGIQPVKRWELPRPLVVTRVLLYVMFGLTLLGGVDVLNSLLNLGTRVSVGVSAAAVYAMVPGIVAVVLARRLWTGGRVVWFALVGLQAWLLVGSVVNLYAGSARGVSQLLLPGALLALVSVGASRAWFGLPAEQRAVRPGWSWERLRRDGKLSVPHLITWRRNRGQSTVEYVGMVGLVALIIGALMFSGVGPQISGGLQTAVCNILGGDCESTTVGDGGGTGGGDNGGGSNGGGNSGGGDDNGGGGNNGGGSDGGGDNGGSGNSGGGNSGGSDGGGDSGGDDNGGGGNNGGSSNGGSDGGGNNGGGDSGGDDNGGGSNGGSDGGSDSGGDSGGGSSGGNSGGGNSGGDSGGDDDDDDDTVAGGITGGSSGGKSGGNNSGGSDSGGGSDGGSDSGGGSDGGSDSGGGSDGGGDSGGGSDGGGDSGGGSDGGGDSGGGSDGGGDSGGGSDGGGDSGGGSDGGGDSGGGSDGGGDSGGGSDGGGDSGGGSDGGGDSGGGSDGGGDSGGSSGGGSSGGNSSGGLVSGGVISGGMISGGLVTGGLVSGGTSGGSSGGKSGGNNSGGSSGGDSGGDSGGGEDDDGDCEDNGSSSDGGSSATGGSSTTGGHPPPGAGPRPVAFCDDEDEDDEEEEEEEDEEEEDDCRDDSNVAFHGSVTTGGAGSGRYILASAGTRTHVVASGDLLVAAPTAPSSMDLVRAVSGSSLPGVDTFQDINNRLNVKIGLTDPPPPPIPDDPEPEPEPDPDSDVEMEDVGSCQVAANPNINWDEIPDYAVYRDSNEPLFRADNRDPSVIFEEGFNPKNTTNADLDNYVLTNQPAQYVSTSTSGNLAFSWGAKFVYDIRTPSGGIDINATYGDQSPYPDQEEVAFPGGIDPRFIKGVWTSGPEGYIPNPNYDPGPGVTDGDASPVDEDELMDDPPTSVPDSDTEMEDVPDFMDYESEDAPDSMDID